jgi:hypothetical protein
MSDHESMTPQPNAESAQGDPLMLDKETLKDLEPSASDQEAARGGRFIIPTRGLKDPACPVYTTLQPPPLLP